MLTLMFFDPHVYEINIFGYFPIYIYFLSFSFSNLLRSSTLSKFLLLDIFFAFFVTGQRIYDRKRVGERGVGVVRLWERSMRQDSNSGHPKCNYALMRPLFSRLFVATKKKYIYIYILLETSHWISDLEIEYIQIYLFIIYLNVFYFNFTFFNPYI